MIRAAILYHVYSGHLFFTAIVLFIIGVIGGRRVRVLRLLAIPLAALSGTPMPLWLAIPLVILGAWPRPYTAPLKVIAVAAAVLAAALELPYHIRQVRVPQPRLAIIIGDSLAAGLGEQRPWPERLGVPVVNLARASDTAVSAVAMQLPHLPPLRRGDLAIIEIGGNDMLDRLDPRAFERALDQIVRAAAPRRTIMLELPIVPGAWRYGAAQRRVARQHGVTLIPKRVLASVLVDQRNTGDGLHLTERGHEQLAHKVRRLWSAGGLAGAPL